MLRFAKWYLVAKLGDIEAGTFVWVTKVGQTHDINFSRVHDKEPKAVLITHQYPNSAEGNYYAIFTVDPPKKTGFSVMTRYINSSSITTVIHWVAFF